MLCATEKDMDLISEESWTLFEEIGVFLKPFSTVTKYMSGSKYLTIAGVVPIFNRLCDHLEDSIAKYESRQYLNKV
jgi:hypothetical protein